MWHTRERTVHKVFVGKSERKRLLGRPKRRWNFGIRMELRKICWGCGVDPFGSG
jgi:hypothetical protein